MFPEHGIGHVLLRNYRPKQPPLDAQAFSPNTAAGACPRCHGLGRVDEVTERAMDAMNVVAA